MRGVSDLMAALLGVERLIYAMLDDPGRVFALAERIAEFWIAFGRAQLDAVPRFAGGYGSFMYNLWAPGTCVWLQEDASALLSPSLYERFILPFDSQIAAAFDYTFIHLHPARYIPFRPLLDTASPSSSCTSTGVALRRAISSRYTGRYRSASLSTSGEISVTRICRYC